MTDLTISTPTATSTLFDSSIDEQIPVSRSRETIEREPTMEMPVSEPFGEQPGLEGGYGKGGFFEGLAKPRPSATKGKGRSSHKRKDAPLRPKIEPARKRTWPYIKMGGPLNSSDMEWNIKVFGRDRIIVNPDHLRERLEKESRRNPRRDLEKQRTSKWERMQKGPSLAQRYKRWKVRQSPKKNLPVRGTNTRHRRLRVGQPLRETYGMRFTWDPKDLGEMK